MALENSRWNRRHSRVLLQSHLDKKMLRKALDIKGSYSCMTPVRHDGKSQATGPEELLNYSRAKSSVTDITYYEKQHQCLHKCFSGKGPILRKKWKVFEQHLFRYQTLGSRWCWFKPTSKWRVMSKKSSRQMTATDLWKLEKCRCTQYASPAQAEQKMDLHSSERHMQAQHPPYLTAFYEKVQQVVRKLNRNNLWKWQIIWKTDHSIGWQSSPPALRIKERKNGEELILVAGSLKRF